MAKVLSFNSIFTESELGNNFKKYLDEKKSTKTLLCLEKICKLENLKSEKEKFDTTIDIYVNFIHENAKFQLPIEHESTRLALFNKFATINEKNFGKESKDIFTNLKSELIAKLKYSFFPRFVRSKFCDEKEKEYFTKHQKILYFKDEDFHVPYITDKELKQMNSFLEDSLNWDLIASSNGTNHPNIFYLNQNILPNSKIFSKAACFKIEGVIPENIESVACVGFNQVIGFQYEKETCKVYSAADILKEFKVDSESERKCIVKEAFYKGVFPFNTPRYTRRVETIDYDPKEGTIVYFHKPCYPEMYKNLDWEKKQKIKFKNFKTNDKFETEGYFTCTLHFICLKKISENMTKLTHIFVASPRGFLNQSKNVIEFGGQLFKSIIRSKINEIQTKSKGMTFENQKDILSVEPLTASLLELKNLYVLPLKSYKDLNNLYFSYEVGKKFEILPEVDYVDDTIYGGTQTVDDDASDVGDDEFFDSNNDFEHPGVLLLME
eukprot:gene6453-10460_t